MKHDPRAQALVAKDIATQFARLAPNAAITVDPLQPLPDQYTTITVHGHHGREVIEVRAMFDFEPCGPNCDEKDPL